MASADVLGLEPASLQVCGSTRLPRHPPACRWGPSAGLAAAEDWHAGLPGPLEGEDGLQLLSELTNASKVTV